jgi:2-keto-4-pentenoate hydratase/2-oxohepta-3-ene-1,7-dioic acid hydratase in catechol pathway
MKLALFDDHRLGVVVGCDGHGTPGVVDVTDALPWPHDPDPLTAGWWRRLCRDFEAVRDGLRDAAAAGTAVPLDEVALLAPALNPSKIVAAASNYAAHVEEMHGVQQRTLGRVESWMMNFDVFLKSPSAIAGPRDEIVLPAAELEAGHEIHHESELVLIMGRGGKDIPVADALGHVLGYTIGLDITVRSPADRSRRKSHDTFAPLGPWVTTADEAGDPADLDIPATGQRRRPAAGQHPRSGHRGGRDRLLRLAHDDPAARRRAVHRRASRRRPDRTWRRARRPDQPAGPAPAGGARRWSPAQHR